LIGGVMAGVLVLAGTGVGVYLATRPKPAQQAAADNPQDPNPADPSSARPGLPQLPGVVLPGQGSAKPRPQLGPAPPLPAGWVRLDTTDGRLSAYFPGKPHGPSEGHSDMSVRVEDEEYLYDLPGEGGGYQLTLMITPPGTTLRPDQEAVFLRLPRHQIERLARGTVTAERTTTLAGFPATELEFTVPEVGSGVIRYGFVHSGGRLLFVVASASGPKVAPADRRTFLDSIRPAEK
jgi:hypothetical protein